MTPKSLLECGFLIPLHRDANLSDGEVHSITAWAWLEDRLSDFGGATRSPGAYEGWYHDPDTGEKITDRSRKYTVAVSRGRVRKLRALLREACSVFQQKCIYLSVAGQVEFIEGPDDASD